METVNRISIHLLSTGTGFIRFPVFHNFTRIPTFCIADRGCDIEVFEQSKSSANRNFMLHPIFPVFYQIRFEQQVIFGFDTV